MPDIAQALADELKWISDNPQRCATCGHLEIFHVTIDPSELADVECQVEGCACLNHEFPNPRTVITVPVSPELWKKVLPNPPKGHRTHIDAIGIEHGKANVETTHPDQP